MDPEPESTQRAGLIAAGAGGASGVAASLVGASPEHVAIVAGSTAAIAFASTVPWSRLRSRKRGPDEIDAQVLRALIRGYKSVTDEFTAQITERFAIPNTIVEPSIELMIASGTASSVAAAIDALDFSWRFGAAIADLDEVLLPTKGSTVLTQWVLIDPDGLTVIDAEVGSVKIDFKGAAKKLGAVAGAVAVVASISGYNAENLGAAITARGNDVSGGPCEMKLNGVLHHSLPATMQKEFGKKLPPNCRIDVNVITPDGLRVELTYTTPPAGPNGS